MEKIYTSRYANSDLKSPNVIKVGISRGVPRFKLRYELSGNIKELAPTSAIFHIENKERFARAYKEQLDQIGKARVMELLRSAGYGDEKPLVLLCYEDLTCDDPKKNWCHRTYLGEWLRENLGIEVEEYPDSSCFAKKAEKKAEKEKAAWRRDDELEGQLSLF